MNKYRIAASVVSILLLVSCENIDLERTNPHDPQNKNFKPSIATLTSSPPSEITMNSAKSGGNITTDGGASITMRGVCWGPNHNPAITENKTEDGNGEGTFISNLSGLASYTKYYVRAYATNSQGTSYGNEVFFTTSIGLPILTTAEILSVTSVSATSGGNITSSSGSIVTARGICWATAPNPTIADSTLTFGMGPDSFAGSMTGLSCNTKYYVRAFATNSAGTAYGNELTFTTNPPVEATLSTVIISAVGISSAKSGGNITSDGGAIITERGVCWSTSPDPTIADNKSSDGSGTGSYTSVLTGLNLNNKYYVRAYATSSVGTAYGNQVFFRMPVTDLDGNVYNLVTIGTQLWMIENLKTTKFNDGTIIPVVTDNNLVWNSLVTPACCWYNNDINNKDIYGGLYNWYTIDAASNGNKNVCPTGFHVPTDDEWTILTDFYGGMSYAGNYLKETGTLHWSVNSGATNNSGFTALPGGFRWSEGFVELGSKGDYWSSTPATNFQSNWMREIYSNHSALQRGSFGLNSSLSVRCISDGN